MDSRDLGSGGSLPPIQPQLGGLPGPEEVPRPQGITANRTYTVYEAQNQKTTIESTTKTNTMEITRRLGEKVIQGEIHHIFERVSQSLVTTTIKYWTDSIRQRDATDGQYHMHHATHERDTRTRVISATTFDMHVYTVPLRQQPQQGLPVADEPPRLPEREEVARMPLPRRRPRDEEVDDPDFIPPSSKKRKLE